MGRKWRAVKNWGKEQWSGWGRKLLSKQLKKQIESRTNVKDGSRKSTGKGRQSPPALWKDLDRHWDRRDDD